MARKIGISVLIAAVGAFLTQAAQAHFNRPLPTVGAVTIDIEPPSPMAEADPWVMLDVRQSERVQVNAEMRALAESSNWVGEYDAEMKLLDYVQRIQNDISTVADLTDAMTKLDRLLTEWPNFETPTMARADVMFRLVRDSVELIYGHVCGDARRGKRVFTPAVVAKAREFLEKADKEGRCAGPFFACRATGVRLQVTREPSKRVVTLPLDIDNADVETLMCIAYLLCHCDRDAALQLEQSLEQARDEGKELRKLEALLRKELDLYSRWLVRVVVVNEGGRPVALGDRAALFVQSRGHAAPASDGQPTTVGSDVTIALERAEEFTVNLKEVSVKLGFAARRGPVVVNPGSAIAIVYRSELTIGKSHPEHRALLALAGEGKAQCQLFLSQYKDGGGTVAIHSPPVPFSKAAVPVSIPPVTASLLR
jgi:hypothetical protein